MPAARQDFREYSYSNDRVLACGKYLGNNTYWKIFVIENLIRIMIHSILSVQYHKGTEWWEDLAGDAKKSYERNKQRYVQDRFFLVLNQVNYLNSSSRYLAIIDHEVHLLF